MYFEQALQLFRMMGDRPGESVALVNLGNDAMIQGDYAAALAYQEAALAVQRVIGDRQGESIALDNLSLTYYYLNDHQKAVETCRQTLDIVETLGLRHVAGYAYNHLGHGLAGLSRVDEAAAAYQRSLDLRMELGAANLACESRAGVARTLLAMGDLAGALRQVEEILDYLQTGSVDGMVEPFRLYLTVYQVLLAAGDARAQGLLAEGHQRLLARAAMIPDPALRDSFLINVAAHRDLIAASQNM
jgi:tetratricopeptide (TPR) repeat protein